MGDLLLDHGGTRDAGTGNRKSHSRRRNFIAATFSPARDEFQSRVAGATNVVVGNTDLTTRAPSGASGWDCRRHRVGRSQPSLARGGASHFEQQNLFIRPLSHPDCRLSPSTWMVCRWQMDGTAM